MNDQGLLQNSVKKYYLLILVFIVGLCLRLYDLGTESIWYDESISIAVAKLGLIQQYKWSFLQNDNNPLFYYEFLHFWIKIFGDSEFASRLPSALFGAFSVIMIFFVGKSLYNRNVGIVAALLLAVSDFHIKYSQEARSYSLLALLALLSIYFFLKLIRSGNRWYLIGYVISSLLMIYTHYYGFFILAAQNIFFFAYYLRNKRLGEITLKKWIKLLVLLGVLYLPGFFLFLKHTVAIQGGFWLPPPNLMGLIKTFILYSGSITLCVILVLFSLFAVFGYGRIEDKLTRDKKSEPAEDNSDELNLSNNSRIYILLLWLFVPILLPYLISLISTPVLLFRYTIAASMAFYLLAARGIEMTGKKLIMLVSVLIILVLSSFSLHTYYNNVDKYQWREAVGYIEEKASTGDYIAVFPLFEIESANYYKKRDDIFLYKLDEEFLLVSDIGNKNLWFVLADHARTDREAFEETLEKKYELLDQKKYKSLNLYQYRKKKAE